MLEYGVDRFPCDVLHRLAVPHQRAVVRGFHRHAAQHQQVRQAADSVGAPAEPEQEDAVAFFVVVDHKFVAVGDVAFFPNLLIIWAQKSKFSAPNGHFSCESEPPESASSRRKCQSGYSSPIGLDVVRFLNAVHRCEQPFGLRAGYVEFTLRGTTELGLWLS